TATPPRENYDEMARGGARDRRGESIIGDLELTACWRTARAVALSFHRPPTRARPAPPYYDEDAIGLHRDRWTPPITPRVGVDLELGADRIAARIVTLSLYGRAGDVATRAPFARPYDDEVAVCISRDRWTPLSARRVRVDLELAAVRRRSRGHIHSAEK